MDAVPTSVLVIWWATLIVAAVVVLPLVVYLLHRAFRAAQQIEHYAAEALEAGAGIAGNTQNIAALEQTIASATEVVEMATSIEGHTATIEEVLTSRAERSTA